MLSLSFLLLTACDVHEWPDTPEMVKFHLRMNYESNMTKWYHQYNGASVVEIGLGEVYDNHLSYGQIRYIVRAYPVFGKDRVSQKEAYEFTFVKNISEGYNHGVTLELPDGDYDIMVWSDMLQYSGNTYFYNTDNFSEIVLQGEYVGNNDHRDAYRGRAPIALVADVIDQAPDTFDIAMQRPLAKYEFVTTDLEEFIDKEIDYWTRMAETRGDVPPTRINTDDYNVVLYFSGYMPNAYNMNSDKPVDSKMGVMFNSKLEVLSPNEASLGFDYVFVNEKKSAVVVQLGLYDKEDREIALTEPINVPLRRSHHTILKGSFLMQHASGGITINPDFNGTHTIVID